MPDLGAVEQRCRRDLDVALLELAVGEETDASVEGLVWLSKRVGTALHRLEAVLSQQERQRPFSVLRNGRPRIDGARPSEPSETVPPASRRAVL